MLSSGSWSRSLVSNRDGEGRGTWWAQATSPGEKGEEGEVLRTLNRGPSQG